MNADLIRVHLRKSAAGFRLEIELQPKLNLSRIACREELSELTDRRQARNAVERGICRCPIGNRLEHVVEDRLVEDIVELCAELKPVAFRETEVLREIQIREELIREAERRSWRTSNLSGQRRLERKRIKRIRNAAIWIVRNIRQRIAHDIRSSASRRYSHRSLNNAIQCQPALSRSDTLDLPTAKERFTNTTAREARMESG